MLKTAQHTKQAAEIDHPVLLIVSMAMTVLIYLALAFADRVLESIFTAILGG